MCDADGWLTAVVVPSPKSHAQLTIRLMLVHALLTSGPPQLADPLNTTGTPAVGATGTSENAATGVGAGGTIVTPPGGTIEMSAIRGAADCASTPVGVAMIVTA